MALQKNKIGLGIITCNRQELFAKCFDSVDFSKIGASVVVNDGKPYTEFEYGQTHLIQHPQNTGVAKTKNDALQYLLDQGCEYIFLLEDDLEILDNSIFDKYIELSRLSGIKHLNFAYHGPANLKNGQKNPRLLVTYKTADSEYKLSLNQHCVGAFSYYHRSTLDAVGLFDEKFRSAFDHVEHTYRIIQNGDHPAFWWFADLANSDEHFKDNDATLTESVIRENPGWIDNVANSSKRFAEKHGIGPINIPDTPINAVGTFLNSVRNKET